MKINLNLSKFFRDVWLITGATVVAQVFTALTLPVITRLYTTQDFEDFGVFVASVAILSSVLSLRFNIAIPLSKNSREFVFTVYIAVLCTLGSAAILLTCYFWLESFISPLDYFKDVWFFVGTVVGAVGMSFYNICVAGAAYSKALGDVSRSKIVRSVAANLTQISLGISSIGGGLLLGYLVLCWAGIVTFSSKAKHFLIPKLLHDRAELLRIFREKRDFPLFSVPEALFFSLGANLPIIIVAMYSQNGEAGTFFLAMKFMSIPMMFLGQSISTVYMTYAPKEKTPTELYMLTKDTAVKLLWFAGLPVLFVGVTAPLYVVYFFGPQWSELGGYIAWLTIGSIFQLLASPLTSSLHIITKTKLAMAMQIGLAIIKIFPVWAAMIYKPDIFLEVFSISNALAYAVLIAAIFFSLKKNIKNASEA